MEGKSQILLAATIFFSILSIGTFHMLLTQPPMSATVIGYSMYPEIQGGDTVYGQPPKLPEDIQIGDIVAFQWQDVEGNQIYICHRVVDVVETFTGETRYVTQGDYDEEFYPRRLEIGFYDIIMVVEDVVRPGTLEYFLKENIVMVFILILIAAAVSAESFLSSLKEET